MSGGRFSIVPAYAVDDIRLPNPALRVLLALGTYSAKDGWCWPSVGTIAQRLGISRQAVQKQIKVLAGLKYIEVRPRNRPDGSQSSNEYRLLFDGVLPSLFDREPTLQPEVAGVQPQVAGGATTGCAPATETPEKGGSAIGVAGVQPPASGGEKPADRLHPERSSERSLKERTAGGPAGAVSPIFIQIPLLSPKDSPKFYGVTEAQVAEWTEAFPAIDVRQKLRDIQQWNKVNESNRKTVGGILKHVVRWLTKEQNSARPGQAPASAPKAERPLTCEANIAGQPCGMPAKNHGGVIECEGCYTKRIGMRGMPDAVRRQLGLGNVRKQRTATS